MDELWVQPPKAGLPPDHVGPAKVVPEAPVIGIAVMPVQTFMALPALTVGGAVQVMTLVLWGSVPAHAPKPVTVNVEVNEPEAVVGVNTQAAGFVG